MLVLGFAASVNACAAPKADCSTESLAALSAAQRVALMSGVCSEVTQYSIVTPPPRVRPLDSTTGPVTAKFGSSTSTPLFDGLLGTFKFNWSGLRTPRENGLRTEQAALGAGGLLRLADMWSLQMNIGREIGSLARSRTSMASIWQPTREALVFAEWADTDSGEAERRVGARWWLMPKLLVLDVGARYVPEGIGWTERNIALKFQMTH